MFRDYVIHAFNTDKPYDEFVREQIAGDEMVPPSVVAAQADDYFSDTTLERRIAAGFHRLGPVRRNAGNAKVAFSRNEVLTERVDVIGAAFLGLTVGCARCHDHMFDPIRQKDYYQMQAFLASTYAHDVPFTDEDEYREWQARTDTVQAELDRIRDDLSQAADEEELRLKSLFEKTKAKLPAPLPTMFSVQNEFDKRTAIHLLDRGDDQLKGELLGMRVLGVLLPEGSPALAADASHPKRRLAEWITRPNHPLTARVMVNRIWQYHFGRGFVENGE